MFTTQNFTTMKKKHTSIYITAIMAIPFLAIPSNAFGGVYTDDLTRCLVSKITNEQKAAFANWIFEAMSLNPAVSKYVTLPEAKRREFKANMGNAFEKLITVTCKSEMQLALKYEGVEAIGASFNVFGEIAGKELFSSPEVANGMADLDQYINKDRIKQAFSQEK
jgi:hypothetical protein